MKDAPLTIFFPYKNETRKRQILHTEVISNNFCQPAQPGSHSSVQSAWSLALGWGTGRMKSVPETAGEPHCPLGEPRGSASDAAPQAGLTESRGPGGTVLLPMMEPCLGCSAGGWARAFLGRLCRRGHHVEPHVHPGTATQAVSDILQCDTLQHQSVLWNQECFWMLLYLFGFFWFWDLLCSQKSQMAVVFRNLLKINITYITKDYF